MTSIATTELRDRLGEPGLTDRRRPHGWPPTTAGASAASRAAATSRAPSSSRAPGSTSEDDAEIERQLDAKGITPGRTIVVYGDGPDDAATLRGPPDAARLRRRPDLRRRLPGLGRGRQPAGRAPAAVPEARLHGVAARAHRRRHARYLRRHGLPPLPRELRGPRGVRGEPPPRRAVPRHQPSRGPGRLEPPLPRRDRGDPARARDHRRHDGRPVRPRHGRRREREVAGPTGRPDRRDPGGAHPELRRGDATSASSTAATTGGSTAAIRSRRSSASRHRSTTFGVADPAAARLHRRHRRGQGDHRRRPGRPRQRANLARAHRRGQRLQLHRPGRPDRRRRLGQLRHRRVPHAALPQHRQHDAGLPGDRGQLGRGRHHPRQARRVLLRHRLARRPRPGSTPSCMDWPRIAVYDGGWFEWSADPVNNPIEIGEPERRRDEAAA